MEGFYLTKTGLKKIKEEYQRVRKTIENKVKEGFPKIFHSDDLNPEYQSLQEDLDWLRAKLANLKHILANAKLISVPSPDKQNVVRLGARVMVEVDGQTDELIIVGSLEANPSLGKISNESPVGKALLGKKEGEEVTIAASVPTKYKIKKIKYPSR